MYTKIEKIVKEPMYQQLNRILRSLIDSEYKLGEQFLTEREICKRFEVSRTTANKALSNLVSEGLLEFRKGVGTFIRRQVLDYNLHSLVSFTNTAIAAGKTPTTRVLRFEKVHSGEMDIPVEGFHGAPDEELYIADRLRLADGVPVIFEHRYIKARLCPDLNIEDIGGSLYSIFTEKYRLSVIGSDEIIRSVGISSNAAKILKVRNNTAGFLILAVGYIEGRIPLWWERSVFRGDVYELHNRLGPVAMGNSPITAFFDFRA